jgi:hypothetical protein
MSKQIVGRDFSHYARRYVKGQEVDVSTFSPDVLKEFQAQGKLIPASSDKASAVMNDPSVSRTRQMATEAERIAQGEKQNGDNK